MWLMQTPIAEHQPPSTTAGLLLMTYRQAAQRLQVSERTVWTLVNTGRLRAVRFGHTVRIDLADLEAFAERAKGGQAGQAGQVGQAGTPGEGA